MCIRNIFIKIFSAYISEDILYIMIYKIDIFEVICYIVYKKEQSKIGGKSREEIGREYDLISQTIEKKCYLQIRLKCQLQKLRVNNMMNICRVTYFIKFNIDGVIPNLAE